MSHSEITYNPQGAFASNIPAYETASTTSQSPNYVQYSVELTTAKPQKIPAIIIEKNMTKGHKHKTVNYNFSQNYFPNHKPANNAYVGTKEIEYEVKEPIAETENYHNSAVVSSSYSTLWNSPENETQAYKPTKSVAESDRKSVV